MSLPATTDQHKAELAEVGADVSMFGAGAPAPRPDVPDDVFAALQTELEDKPGRAGQVREHSTRVRVAVALAGCAVLALGTLALTPRADLGVHPTFRLWLGILCFGGGSAAVTMLALRPLQRPLISRRVAFGVIALGAVVLPVVLALLPVAHQAHPASLEGGGADFVPRAMACLVFGLAMAAPIVGLIRLLDRTGHAFRDKAVLAAVAAGLLGNLSLQLHCPIVHQSHLVAGHALSAVLAVVVYSIVIRISRR